MESFGRANPSSPAERHQLLQRRQAYLTDWEREIAPFATDAASVAVELELAAATLSRERTKLSQAGELFRLDQELARERGEPMPSPPAGDDRFAEAEAAYTTLKTRYESLEREITARDTTLRRDHGLG